MNTYNFFSPHNFFSPDRVKNTTLHTKVGFFSMASAEIWMTFMINAGIPEKHAKEYSDIFAAQSMSIDTVTELDRDTLTELGVATIGHALSILKHAKKADIKPAKSLGMKTAAPKPPQLVADLTRPQFRKFRIDWDVYKKISCMETDRIPAQIYSLCDANVQNSIINTTKLLRL